MHFDFAGQLEAGRPLQAFLQNLFLDRKLMFVRSVLVVAAAAAGKVGTRRVYAAGRAFDDSLELSASKTRFLLAEGRLDLFPSQDERHEHRLPAPSFVRGKAGQTVAAIDQFFYCEEQEAIL